MRTTAQTDVTAYPKHWSYSSIYEYASICQLRWWFRRVAAVPPESRSGNLIFGSSIHVALAELALQRKAGRSMDVEAGISAFETAMKAEFSDGEIPIDLPKGETQESLLTKGRSMLQVYAQESKNEHIEAVSKRFSIFLTDADGKTLVKPLVGEFDLVIRDGKGRIIVSDWKTAARKKSDREVEADLQATVYSLVARELYGEDVGFRFEVLSKTKSPTYTVHTTHRNQRDFARFVELVKSVQRGVKAGGFLPDDSSSF